jgi:type II secretory ATPase GspE/PulE/Tfp pilus assembly ATPase PilB-like protein
MGVEPYLVASSLEAVLAQRLVRVLCKHCKQPDTSPTTAAIKAQIGIPTDTTVFRGVGCRECRNTGYHGRRAIFEWMDIDNELRQLVLKNVSSGEIAALAKRNGLRVLSEDGWRLVREGITTPEEVMRVTKDQSVSNIAPEAVPKPTVEVQSPRKSNAVV